LFNKEQDFIKKKRFVEHKMCVLTSFTNLSKRIERDIIINIYLSKYSLFMSEFKEAGISSIKYSKKNHSNTKFHENPSSGSQVVPCGETDRHADKQTKKIDGQT